MKLYNKWAPIILVSLLMMIGTGCQDFLKEDAVSTITSDSYYTTSKGFDDLVRSCYPLLRDLIRERNLIMLGTDMFTNLAWDKGADNSAEGSGLNLYDIRLNSSVGELQTLWDILYREIGRTNTVISRQDKTDMAPALRDIRVGEAKFLRALSYFHLVQQWGDVPMPLEETKTSSKEVIKSSAQEVYAQILKDLTEAEAVLPEVASDYGRATKGAAQFLLARVYLTRGWNFENSLGGSPADFNKALEFADKIIAKYPLAANYKDLFPLHSENPLTETFPSQNDKNPEIVFSVQFSDDVLTYKGDVSVGSSANGNDYHSIFGGNVEDMPGALARSSDYNRHLDKFTVTPAMYRLFDPQKDTRYEHDFVDAVYALRDVPNFKPVIGNNDLKINISKGDTVVSFRPWNTPAALADRGIDVGGSKPYAVINTDQFGVVARSAYHGEDKVPMMWKFWQPGIPYGDDFGTFNFALFRSAEAYLIAAEAIVKGAGNGQLGGADVYYNRVLDRALGANAGSEPMGAKFPGDVASLEAVSYRATPANISIDMILDERARELLGENMRWYDLKRTGKLAERTNVYNPWTKIKGQMEAKHLLRPIPQSEIDRSSPPISQNKGY